jgi:hypothetical protein
MDDFDLGSAIVDEITLKVMLCDCGYIPIHISLNRAYHRRMTGEGLTYNHHLKIKITCPDYDDKH